MDYEEKYKKALERARDVYTYYCDDREQLRKIESIFPELKELEDEKIRKNIVTLVNEWWDKIGSCSPGFATQSEMLSWLEKQDEQWKPSDEQMKQLGWIAKQNKDNMIGKELMTLYNDLKKLREK